MLIKPLFYTYMEK